MTEALRSSPANPPRRVLMGPGPSDVPDSVLRALAAPTVGHLDPVFLGLMDVLREQLRAVLCTSNEVTLPVSGTGSAGMETCLVNLIEPGDRVLVGQCGVFGGRLADTARRAGAEVVVAEGPWGRALDRATLEAAAGTDGFDLVCVVHAETSTGVLQDLTPAKEIAESRGALLLVDAVTSVAGVPVLPDGWGIDALYTGTQKCLSCPPGLAPVTLSPRAVERIERRRSPVQSWYLDLSMVRKYWGEERTYHHTAPINMLYGLHEALRLVLEEGLEARHARHRRHGAALVAGLEALGLEPRVPEVERLPQLTTVGVPKGVEDARVRRALLQDHGIEIGGGLGPMAGNTWRVGLMGASCTPRNVTLLLSALQAVLRREGHRAPKDPVAAAEEVWART